MNIVIQKAQLNGIFLSYEFEQKDTDSNNLMKVKSDLPVHDDLRTAFRNLIPHFAFICDQVTDENLFKKACADPLLYTGDRETAPDDTFFKYQVYAVSLNTKKGNNKITMHGCRQVGELFEEISFSSPEIDLDSDKYKYAADLAELVEVLKSEVMAYMEGKHAAKTQMAMFEGEEEEADEQGAFLKVAE
ncbi:hypothetical protein [Flavobacterium sp.]|jgi:hypothetical protein|uniref:hypothetical protein n=1 Tax=Flavobacterium sp. TaxID=239 RepID=UPI0022C6C384|nr:hypothetical protein [Flavobacterium sp.]MCZ8144888.1 hypothetical protein [Flavobacterium sp.]